MNWDTIHGKWDQFKGEVKSRWAKLTDEDLKNLAGQREVLVGKIQERYGIIKSQAEREVAEWLDRLGDKLDRIKPSKPSKPSAPRPA